jgi:hypothetical protein
MGKPFLPKHPDDNSSQKSHPKFCYEDKIGDDTIKFSIGLRTDWAEMAEKEVTDFVIAFEDPDDAMLLSILGIEKYFALGWINQNEIGLWSFSGNSSHSPAKPELLNYYFTSILALKTIQDRPMMVLCHVPQDRNYVFEHFPTIHDGREEGMRGFEGSFDCVEPTVLTNAINEFMLNYIN